MGEPLTSIPQHYSYRAAVTRLAELGISLSERTLKRLVKQRKLGCRRPGGRVVIGEDQLQAYLEAVTEDPYPDDNNPENTGSTRSPGPTIGTSTGTTRRLDVSAARRQAQETVDLLKRGRSNSSASGSRSDGVSGQT